MKHAIYACPNRKCRIQRMPANMLGANPKCPECGRWMVKTDSVK